MKQFLLILALFTLTLPCFGQVKVTVTGTLLTPSGAPAVGTITVSNPAAFVSADGYYIAANTQTIVNTATNGTFSVALVPNANSLPASYYDVRYALGNYDRQNEYWVVPASGPVTLTSVVHFTSPTVVDDTMSQTASSTYTLIPGTQEVTLSWPRTFADTNYILTGLTMLGGNGEGRITETTLSASGLNIWLDDMDTQNDITVTINAAAIHN